MGRNPKCRSRNGRAGLQRRTSGRPHSRKTGSIEPATTRGRLSWTMRKTGGPHSRGPEYGRENCSRSSESLTPGRLDRDPTRRTANYDHVS